MSELVVGATMVAWLEAAGWRVYQEVQPGRWDGVADIVGVKNEVVLIVECKTGLGLSVIEQAIRWKGSAPLIAVAVPAAKSVQGRRRRWLGEEILRNYGIGFFRIGEGFDGKPYIRDEPDILPEWNCNLDRIWKGRSVWLDVVDEGHRTHAKAGSSGGGHLTPFKVTMELMADFVVSHPGCTRKEIAEGVDHHYGNDASFRNAMGAIAMNGWCPAVEERTEGRRCRYYPSEGAKKGRA